MSLETACVLSFCCSLCRALRQREEATQRDVNRERNRPKPAHHKSGFATHHNPSKQALFTHNQKSSRTHAQLDRQEAMLYGERGSIPIRQTSEAIAGFGIWRTTHRMALTNFFEQKPSSSFFHFTELNRVVVLDGTAAFVEINRSKFRICPSTKSLSAVGWGELTNPWAGNYR